MLFAMVIEREPMQWSALPGALKVWVQTVGVIAGIALALWLIAYLAQRRAGQSVWPTSLTGWVCTLFLLAAAVLYSFLGLVHLGKPINITALADLANSIGDQVATAAGLCAILAVLTPLAVDLTTRMRWARIWALTRLSIKEAIRSRVVLIFGLVSLVFLFADWFVPYKPEDQLRQYVAVIYWSLPPLFLVTASL